MSLLSSSAKVTGATGASSFFDYPIEQSLRFDGSSYLSKTFGSGTANQKTFTYSIWVKLAESAYEQDVFAGGPATDQLHISFYSDRFGIRRYASGSTAETYTVNLLRDYSSWYHLVVKVDTTQTTDTNKVKIYINGLESSSLVTQSGGTVNWPSTDEQFYISGDMYIGRRAHSADNFFYGYLANIQFIDGQALDQYFFGEFKDNIWVPYNAFSTAGSGTATASDGDTATDSYGTNGFHLDFADSSNIGNDVSGNNNDWTVN